MRKCLVVAVVAYMVVDSTAAVGWTRLQPLENLATSDCVCLFVPAEVFEDGSARGACKQAAKSACPEDDFLLTLRPPDMSEMSIFEHQVFRVGVGVLVGAWKTDEKWWTRRTYVIELLGRDDGAEVVETYRAIARDEPEELVSKMSRVGSLTSLTALVMNHRVKKSDPDLNEVDVFETLIRRDPKWYECSVEHCVGRGWTSVASYALSVFRTRHAQAALLRYVRDLPTFPKVARTGPSAQDLVVRVVRECRLPYSVPLSIEESESLLEGFTGRLKGLDDDEVSCQALR